MGEDGGKCHLMLSLLEHFPIVAHRHPIVVRNERGLGVDSKVWPKICVAPLTLLVLSLMLIHHILVLRFVFSFINACSLNNPITNVCSAKALALSLP